MQQEAHHVGLGEELGDGGQLVGADLDAGFVHCVLLGGAPVLIGPAQTVIGSEYSRIEAGHQAL